MVVEAEGRIIPYGFTEQDVIVNLGEFRGEFPKSYTPGSLLDIMLRHNVLGV